MRGGYSRSCNHYYYYYVIFQLLIIITYFWQYSLCKDGDKDGDLKLIDGNNPKEGTLLIFKGYGWGTICDDNWTIKEAKVACNQMNMGGALMQFKSNFFNTYNQDYLLDDVYCNGTETSLLECQHSPFGKHDCRPNEFVGVRCERRPKVTPKNKNNPLNLKYDDKKLFSLRKNAVKVELKHFGNDSYLVLINNNGQVSPICPLNFFSPEANVVCKEKFGNMAESFKKISLTETEFNNTKYVSRAGRCFGNETELSQCHLYLEATGIQCDSTDGVLVKCGEKLPDIRCDYLEAERSSYMDRVHIWHLKCALTENCLPSSIHKIIQDNPVSHPWMMRTLMRFSSIIENAGKADFMPINPPDQWEWHGCHMHYHSMKVFANYQVYDMKGRKVADGLKASFCLEDNICDKFANPKFRCSSTLLYFGTQGISPGCKDTYFHDYDCQWLDITDLPLGNYIFQMTVNPDFLVPESDFFNNGLMCSLYHVGYNAILRSCSWKHPYELFS